VALNWLRGRGSGVMIPIIGARSLAQAEENLAAYAFELDDEHLERLAEATRIELGFPHDFLSTRGVQQVVYGSTLERIDNHRR